MQISPEEWIEETLKPGGGTSTEIGVASEFKRLKQENNNLRNEVDSLRSNHVAEVMSVVVMLLLTGTACAVGIIAAIHFLPIF